MVKLTGNLMKPLSSRWYRERRLCLSEPVQRSTGLAVDGVFFGDGRTALRRPFHRKSYGTRFHVDMRRENLSKNLRQALQRPRGALLKLAVEPTRAAKVQENSGVYTRSRRFQRDEFVAVTVPYVVATSMYQKFARS